MVTNIVLGTIVLCTSFGMYVVHSYAIHTYPPQIGYYENIAIWGEYHLEVSDLRPPAYSVIYAPIRSY